MAKLEVEIGADKKDFDLKVKEVEKDIKELSQVKLERIKLGLDTKDINLNIKDAKKSLNDLKTSLKDTGQSFGQMGSKVQNGGNTLMQFSRIAQDAPFGIMGIGNNITATAESFSYLSASSGGAGNALKAVASSMLGTGGILLAVSLVTSALTYMSQNGITVGDVFKKLTGQFDEFANALSKAGEEAAKNASEQISSANAYVSAAKNINLSMSDRLLAVKKLQDEYPAYFGNLSKEQILNGDVRMAVEGVTAALIAKAKAAAFSSKIAELATEEFKLREQEAKQINEVNKAYTRVNSLLKDKSKLASEAGANIGSAYVSEKESLRDIQDNIRSNQTEQAKYTAEINKATAASLKLLTVTEKQAKAKKEKPSNVTPQVSSLQNNLQPSGLADTSNSKILNGGKDEFGNKTMSTGGAEFALAKVRATTQAVSEEYATLLQLARDFDAEANNLLTTSIASTFTSLGSAIGEALANGGNVFKAIGNTLLNSLGNFLSDMGALLIKYGTLAVVKGKLDLAILAGGPVSIGAGIAAIAVGVALSAAGSAISSKVQSGSSSGNSNISTGRDYSSPNTSGFGSSGSNSGTVVFEISGQSLIGVLSNTLDRNSRLGGALSIG